MAARLATTFLAALLALSPAIAQDQTLIEAQRLEEAGKFREAAEILSSRLAESRTLSTGERKTLEFELDRLNRIRMDYSLTRDQLFGQLEQSIKDMTRPEFDRWISEGRFDRRTIDGEERFLGVSRSNLFFRYPYLNSRRITPRDESAFERAVLNACRDITRAAEREKRPFVLPKSFRTVMRITVNPGSVGDGEVIRAWLPIPRTYPHQKGFRLLASSSPVRHLADEFSPIRSVYLEQAATKDEPTRFWIEYVYTTYGVRFNTRPQEVQPADRNDPELTPFLAEAPHVLFTEKIKRLSDDIAGNEANPLLRAKKFYDWIAGTIRYSYALEYSTIRNISEYCLTKRYGDCGQAALLFITLCRYNGIPARWQSGWFTFPGGKTIHDWTEIYVHPYGWMPVDPYMGVFAMQYMTSLKPEERLEVRDFYFGGLDQYRMAANSDHNQTLEPPKQTLRSDNVDFQRGELEAGLMNLYFDKYSFDLTIEESDPP